MNEVRNFPRGLRLHRYKCVALKGFWQRAESLELRVYQPFLDLNPLNLLNPLNPISRGAYTSVAIILSGIPGWQES